MKWRIGICSSQKYEFFQWITCQRFVFAVLCSAYIIWFILHWQVEDKFKLTLEYTNTCSLSDTDIGSFLASNITNTLRMIVGLDENETIGNVNEHSFFSNKKKFLFFLWLQLFIFWQKHIQPHESSCVSLEMYNCKYTWKAQTKALNLTMFGKL